MANWDHETDVLVCGSGLGGLTAALVARLGGLEVLLCEKSDAIGGTTAMSGGTVWVPGNRHSERAGHRDSVDDARRYLDAEIGDEGREMREAFLSAGAEALDYLEQNSEVKFHVNGAPYPDYHLDTPGAALGWRALTALPFDGRKLGHDFAMLRPPMREFVIWGGMMAPREQLAYALKPFSSLRAMRISLPLAIRYATDRLRHARGTALHIGNALVARYVFSLRRAGADIWTRAPVLQLLQEKGNLRGAVIGHDGQRRLVRARRAVVLSTGGFAASAEWRKKLFREFFAEHFLTFEGNTGDGLALALGIGAAIDEHHESPAFWQPASILRRRDGSTAIYSHIRDRAKPGLIAVNSAGRRFTNEADSYHDFALAMFRSHRQTPTIPAALVCDSTFLTDYGIGLIRPAENLKPYLESGYLIGAASLAELARKLGIEGTALEQTVAEHNRFARAGLDQAFGKGSTAFNLQYADARNRPNPCLRPIEHPPFYAVKVFPAPSGTSIGLRTDPDARVLDRQGHAIAGLYAVGNDMSSIMQGFYAGPGINLGPGLVFGYRAAQHVQRNATLL